MDVQRFLSNAVLGGPPLALPDPPAPILYNFDGGYPSPETHPIERLKALAASVLDDPAALGYVTLRYDAETSEPIYHEQGFSSREEMVFGNVALRDELAGWIGRRQNIQGLESRNFILTSGGTQAVALATAAFVNPGEGVLVENLSFPMGLHSLRLRGADVRGVDLDGDGLVPESLEKRLREFRRDGVKPKLLYLIPTFHLPTGSVMPLERRKRVLEIAEEWDLLVIEDGIYCELRFDGPPTPPSLLSLDTSGRVLQTHAFSKIIGAGLRLGWMSGPPELINALGVVREDLGVSQWISRIVLEFMRGGHLDPQIERACGIYREKRDVVTEGLRASCGDFVDFMPPHGGLFTWVGLSDAVDWAAAKNEAALKGVAVREANAFLLEPDDGPVRHFRIGFSHGSRRQLEAGTAILGAAITAAARTPASA